MALSKDIQNFVNLHHFLTKSTESIRQIFLNNYKEKYNQEWTENRTSAQIFFNTEKNQSLLNSMTSKQKNYALAGDSSKWDITLFYMILNRTKLISNSKFKQIEKIKDVRNKIAHSSTMSLNDEEYQKNSKIIEDCLAQLGVDNKEIENFRLNLTINNMDKPEASVSKHILNKKEEADKYFSEQNYSKAIELYTIVIESDLSKDLKAKVLSNRSLSYLRMFIKDKRRDKDFLFKALVDVEQSINYNPKWFKAYARLGQVYVEFNEIPKAIENFTKALVLDPSNEEIKTLLAETKYLDFEQSRLAHLDESTQPQTVEERGQEFMKQYENQFGRDNSKKSSEVFENIKEILIKGDKTLEDVFLGHEYRDGSKNHEQNYEMAAKYYSKAAKNGNIEAIYNLSQLTFNGKGVKQDLTSAIEMLKNAASKPPTRKVGNSDVPIVGVAESQHFLGILYQQGIYVIKNMALAIDFYEKAAANGSSKSANNLGLLYLNGDGVEADLDRAENLFLFCYKKGSNDSISNLINLYILKGDPENALLWHNRALEKKLLYEENRSKSLMETITTLINKKKFANIPENKSVDSFFKENFPQLKMLENFCFKTYPNNKTIKIYDQRMLTEYANNGSVTAKRMLEASLLFCDGINEFEQNQNSDIHDLSPIIDKLSRAFQLEHLVCQVPSDIQEKFIAKLEKILSLNLNDNLNFNSSLCYMHMIYSNYEQTILFIDDCLKKYSNCLQMHLIKGSIFCFMNRFEDALKEFDFLIQKEKDNFEYFYSKAETLKNLRKFDDALSNFEFFIKNAPKDHRKIPEAYYSIGECKLGILLDEKNAKEYNIYKVLNDYIIKGEQSEKEQLPCFLPYESSTKNLLLKNISFVQNPQLSNSDMTNFIHCDENRIKLIMSHRKSFFDMKKFQSISSMNFNNTITPQKIYKSQNYVSFFKDIKLKQIDFRKDEILNGYKITLRVFDVPLFGYTSTFFIVDDVNGSIERISVYNLGRDYEKIRKDFPIGIWFELINPYIRQAADGQPMIRVDNPNNIKFIGKITNKMCRYCGKENSTFKCSKCMEALYCSKQCQINDWKQLNHKQICI
ncbi:unnamed protein product [Brachionus calyciflorus]|uniref:MYND-type domain-containing protein n=1 Tax=Brachionus calyciflorus TaxID=104777 RepID=A0A813XBA4_9BILA|nr:unnamed protein product [Brachionus calyciflorus]